MGYLATGPCYSVPKFVFLVDLWIQGDRRGLGSGRSLL